MLEVAVLADEYVLIHKNVYKDTNPSLIDQQLKSKLKLEI